MKKYIPILGCFLLAVILAGCSSLKSRSQELKLGMSKEQAIKLLDEEFSVVAARQESDGSSVEVIQFEEKGATPLVLYFRDGKLIQWGDTSALGNLPEGQPE